MKPTNTQTEQLGRDRSREYEELRKTHGAFRMQVDERLALRLRNHVVVLVPGFLSDAMRELIYFAEQRRAFSELPDVEVEMPDFDSEDTPEENGRLIGEAIARYGRGDARDLVLLTHSKGSLDTLHALVGNTALQKRIACWVSLQGAIMGSPVADCVASDPTLGPKASKLLDSLFDGDPGSLLSLRTSHAGNFVASEADSGNLRDLLDNVPTLFYGSSAKFSLLLEPTRRAMENSGHPNDGLVPRANCFLPHAPFVSEVNGPDHASAVMPGWPFAFDEVKLSSILISMCLG